jgi:hypothetical protein
LALLLIPIGNVICWEQRGQDDIDIEPPEYADHVKFSTAWKALSII